MTLLQKPFLTTKDTKVTKFFEIVLRKILNFELRLSEFLCVLREARKAFVSFVVKDLFAVDSQITQIFADFSLENSNLRNRRNLWIISDNIQCSLTS